METIRWDRTTGFTGTHAHAIRQTFVTSPSPLGGEGAGGEGFGARQRADESLASIRSNGRWGKSSANAHVSKRVRILCALTREAPSPLPLSPGGERGFSGAPLPRENQSKMIQSKKSVLTGSDSRPAVGCRRRCRRFVPSGSPRASSSPLETPGPGCPGPPKCGHEKTLPALRLGRVRFRNRLRDAVIPRHHPSSLQAAGDSSIS